MTMIFILFMIACIFLFIGGFYLYWVPYTKGNPRATYILGIFSLLIALIFFFFFVKRVQQVQKWEVTYYEKVTKEIVFELDSSSVIKSIPQGSKIISIKLIK